MVAPPTNPPAAGMTSMFKNARGVNISSSSFNMTTSVNTGNGQSLEVLHRRVAPNAILNAGGRADEVRCYPGTREEVIERIELWGDGQDAPIFWLSGPAGAGKSSVMQTIAERCQERGVPHASFFFFRGDKSRSHASALVATLVYQIISLYPSLRDLITALLHADPFILDSTLDNQLQKLIVAPLRSMRMSSLAEQPLLLLIDGLDECDSETKHSQQQILHAFDKVFARCRRAPCPFRLLVASRDESQIQMGFNQITSQCRHLYLDEKYSPEKDIRLFVIAQFEKVRRTHPLAHMLSSNWPSIKDVDYIVEKSSGQFIYAATVLGFILNSSASPIISLDRVKGAAQLATKSPFSHLDAIYTYILSQVDDQQALKDILHAQFLIDNMCEHFAMQSDVSYEQPHVDVHQLLEVYNHNYCKATVVSCVVDLIPLAKYDDKLEFYHASFPDYLFDKSRSGDYFIDLQAFNNTVLPILWQHADRSPGADLRKFTSMAVISVLLLEGPHPDLLNTISACKQVLSEVPQALANFFVKIYELCITDEDIENFRHIFREWIIDNKIHRYDYCFKVIQHIPFAERYIQMADANKYNKYPPTSQELTALRPKTEFDRDELALWLEDLLPSITYDSDHAKKYKKLLKAWITWIVANNIPLNGPDNGSVDSKSEDTRKSISMPYSDWYFAMARADYRQPPDDKISAALYPDSESARQELGVWFKDLLRKIYNEVYPHNSERYQDLMKAWISWALQNSVPCQDLDNFPGAKRYVRMSIARKWVASKLGFSDRK